MNKTTQQIDITIIIPIILGIIYILFYSNNNSIDSYVYASCIKENFLFLPHHLLFNAFGYLCAKIFSIQDTLRLTCVINALFATGCLFLLRSILLHNISKRTTAAILVLVGSCYGFMRFATEGETYIIPLFFSLAASQMLLYRHAPLKTSLLAAVACLFHQIHFFWWLGLGFYFIINGTSKEKKKNIAYYLLGALIVPVVYLIVFYSTPTDDCDNIIQYIFHDYIFSKGVGFNIKHALLLTPISFIRTFAQVHGYIYPLLQKYPIILLGIIPAIVSLCLCFKKSNGIIIQAQTLPIDLKNYAQIHLLICICQLLFAFSSNGNAEFMVMLPFALSIYIFYKYIIRLRYIICIGCSLFLWNMSVGILPYHYISLYPHIALQRYVCKYPERIYSISNIAQIKQMASYYYPESNIKIFDENYIPKQDTTYTDRFYNTSFLSRSTFVETEVQTDSLYSIEIVDTLKYDLGVWYISTLKKKDIASSSE